MQVFTYPESKTYTLYNTFEHPVIGLKMWGDSVQDGTPTFNAPIPIVSVGDDVAINVTSCGKNLLNIRNDLPITVSGVTISRDNTGNIILNGTATATISVSLSTIDLPYNTYTMSIDSKIEGIGISCTDFGSIFLSSTKNSVTIENSGSGNLRLNVSPNIVLENFVLNPQIELGTTATVYKPYKGNTATITSGLPLCSVGDVRDELVYNADGTGKIIKHTAKLDSYNGEEITTDYISSTGGLDTGAKVVYVLNTPQEIELSAAEMAALVELQTMDKITNVFNSDNAEMQITFLGGQEMETNVDGFWDSEDGDRKYSAADFVGFFQDFFTNGIVAESTTYLQVRAKEDLTVRVNVGKAYINGGFFKPKTVTDLTIEDSDTTNPRYDMVVLRWDATIKKIYLDIVKGTPAATPSVPALTRNEIVYELGLARIYVAANTLQITQADITDLRFNSAYCGVVKGVIDTIDTTDLFAQYEKAWIDFVAQLGDSDHVEISTIDEQARADIGELQEDVAEHTATLETNAPYKILTGSGTASGGSTSITFETAFKTVPVVIVAPYSTSTTAARACTCHLSAISATGFTVKTYTVTGATSANVENTGIGFRWVAFGT